MSVYDFPALPRILVLVHRMDSAYLMSRYSASSFLSIPLCIAHAGFTALFEHLSQDSISMMLLILSTVETLIKLSLPGNYFSMERGDPGILTLQTRTLTQKKRDVKSTC